MSIFKDCDIRGIYGRELDQEDGYRVGRALATMTQGSPFCVGGDVRLSTPALKARLIQGLLDGGSRVLDLGVIATPVMYFALNRLEVAGGAMVTASHNPPQYNGVKFMLGHAPVTREQMDRMAGIVARGDYRQGQGQLVPTPMLEAYRDFLVNRFGPEPKGLKVVVDAGNGAMSAIAPQAMAACGYQVEELFCQPDGRFPNRTPNPAEYDKLTALSRRVLDTGADLGVAFDGDGDRAVFCDEKGQVIISERILVLFIRYLLRDKPTPVVYDQKSSSVVKRAILAAGGQPVPERSGHTFIKRRFLENGAAVAGEVSGHFFFGELGYDDGLFAALTLAQALGCWKASLSQVLAEVVCPPITPDLRVFCPYGEQDQVLEAVERAFRGHPVSHLDGVRVEMDRGWLLIRKSVTAEQMTVRVEGETQADLERILDGLRKVHPRLGSL